MDGLWRFWLSLAVTVAALVAVVVAWPEDDGPEAVASGARPPTTTGGFVVPGAGGGLGEPSARGDDDPGTTPTPPVDLFTAGAAEALGQLLAAAGGPTLLHEVAVYPTYLIAAYVDPAQPEHIDRRVWRAGVVDGASPNPIDDRVDASTQASLFGPEAVDLTRLAAMAADARTRYDRPVDVTHVLIDRFLPFDERVLVRVYARPSDGRSGGGYVSYLPDGTFVDVCC